MYGPLGAELEQAKGNKQIEQRIVEEHLQPRLQQFLDILERDDSDDAKMALTSALATVVQRIFKGGAASAGTERIAHYVAREKSFKSRLISKNRKAQVRGHHLVLRQFQETTHCNHCGKIMWGVAPQGFQCGDCNLNVHRGCARLMEETCPGPMPSGGNERGQVGDRITKFMDRIREKGHGE